MKRINVQNESNVRAEGHRVKGNCKPVFCITTGEVFTSVSDAAEKLGVTSSTVSWVITGRMATCKGVKLCLISDVVEHLDEIAESIQQKNVFCGYHKATQKAAQHKANITKLQQKLEKEMKLLEMAESEVKKYNTEDDWIM